MGSWGTAIFSDDFAADIRGDWRDAIIAGEDPVEVTRGLVERYGQDGRDPDETIVFWVALAAAQMETGRLGPAVRERALTIIEAGGDLARWREQDPMLARQRQRVLARLAEKLRGPQPAPKRLRRTSPPGLGFDVGDAIRLRSEKGFTDVIAIVVADSDGWPRGTLNPVVELTVWQEHRDPTASELAQLPVVLSEHKNLRADLHSHAPHLFIVVAATTHQRFGPPVRRDHRPRCRPIPAAQSEEQSRPDGVVRELARTDGVCRRARIQPGPRGDAATTPAFLRLRTSPARPPVPSWGSRTASRRPPTAVS